MLLVVGLGNPGSEYDGTRHNVGFGVVRTIADGFRMRFSTRHLSRIAAGSAQGVDIVLCQPLTYMNNSGEAVRSLLSEFRLPPEGLLVCCDDLHLPLGTVRLRKTGGDGGHNGLRSVIREIGSDAFPRLRCGIRGATVPGPGEATADYVLSAFERSELSGAEAMVKRAAASVLMLARHGIDRAMNIVNTQ
jgi:PTH1 family peptidyl-tRNA hydrolase